MTVWIFKEPITLIQAYETIMSVILYLVEKSNISRSVHVLYLDEHPDTVALCYLH